MEYSRNFALNTAFLFFLSLPGQVIHSQNYDKKIATGTILASGTLGQIIPPSIVLILLGDVISSSYQEAQNMQGIFSQFQKS